jgi:hypothetical protein
MLIDLLLVARAEPWRKGGEAPVDEIQDRGLSRGDGGRVARGSRRELAEKVGEDLHGIEARRNRTRHRAVLEVERIDRRQEAV